MNQLHIRDQAHEDAVGYWQANPDTHLSGKQLEREADKQVIGFVDWLIDSPEEWAKNIGYIPDVETLTEGDKYVYRRWWIATYKLMEEINADMKANPQDYS